MLSVFHKIIRSILIVIPIVILGWLSYKEIAPSGKVTANYDMRRETPFISKLYPKDRVSGAYQGTDGGFHRVFLAEPVYFDLKPNDNFERVAVTVKYKNSGAMPIKMGGLINEAAWAFDWRDLPPTGGKWKNQTEFFDFSKLIPEGSKYRFGFSVEGMRTEQIALDGIEVLFARPELGGKEIVNKILEGISWRVNKIF